MRFFVLAFLLSVPLFALAHGDSPSFEATKDGYLIDIGYSTPAPSEGESVAFNFGLTKEEGGAAPFSDVWVKIVSSEKNVVFASGIHNAELGGPRMTYVFPGPGTYSVEVRYEDEATKLVETSFPLTVVPREQAGDPALYVWFLAGGAFGSVAALLLGRMRKRGS